MSNSHTGGYVDPNFPEPNNPGDAPIIIYGYRPSEALAILAIVLFAISFILHTFQVIKYKTWYFIPTSVGCLFEVVGYISRFLSANVDPYRVDFFVVQYFFIVVAPVLFSASIYMILNLLIRNLGAQYSPLNIPPRAILWIFITSDVIATIIQVIGSALIGVHESHREDPTVPNDILLGGLAVQVASFFIFVVLLAAFCWRAQHILMSQSSNTPPVQNDAEKVEDVALMTKSVSKSFVPALWVATIAVYLRTCYRLSETAQHNYGSKAHNVTEVEFGILEFAPIVVCVYVLALWHPGRFLAPQ